MKAVIVGCGRIAGGWNERDDTAILTHALAYRRAAITLAGCVDRDESRARRFAARWSIPEYGCDVADVLARTGASLVSDCTPPQSRLAVVGAALAAPTVRVVIAEKPFGADEATARALAARCAESDKRVLVNHHRAYDPCYRKAERWVRDGVLGRMQWVVGHAYGGALNGLSHLLERAIAMLGPVREARAVAAPSTGEPGDEALALCVEFENNCRGVFLPLAREGFAGVEIDLMGTDGRLRIVDSERRVEFFRSRAAAGFGCEGLRLLAPVAADLPVPDWQALKHVVAAAARGDEDPACPPARAAEVVCLIDRVRRHGSYRAPPDGNNLGTIPQ